MTFVKKVRDSLFFPNKVCYLILRISCPGGGPACRQAGLADYKINSLELRMFNVYVLKSCERNYLYVGMTNNLNRRVAQHNLGRERTTRSYAPFEIVLVENFGKRLEARKREKYLKSGCGKEYIKRDILKLR